MRETPVLDMVKKYVQSDTLRFHMPAHKGDVGFFGGELNRADITEIPGADNLLCPNGVIEASCSLFAKNVGAKKTFYSVNGSTGGVHAMLASVINSNSNPKILMGRDSHISAINTLCLLGGEPVFVDVDTNFSVLGCVSPQDIRKTLEANPGICAVYLTYPNYFGLCANLSEIANIVHSYNIPLLIDGAHSAAFPYSNMLPLDPIACGADVYVASLHKTLPALTQTAVINIAENSLVPEENIERALKLFTTTSPSYLLLSSIDYVSAYMKDAGAKEIFRVISQAAEFIKSTNPKINFPLLNSAGTGNIFDNDPLKLTIDVTGLGLTGFLAEEVLNQNNIYIETCDLNTITLILGVADNKESFNRLAQALDYLPEGIITNPDFNVYDLPKGEAYCTPFEAYNSSYAYVLLSQSENEVCAGNVGVYPPGIPALIAGQIINAQMIDYLTYALECGYNVFGYSDGKIPILF